MSVAGLNTLTIPAPNACDGVYLPDIQTSYPAVDFDELDRLYLSAGHYSFLRLGNLPLRKNSDPLVITNLGGQVRVGGCGHHYNFSITGGKNWILTGEYDVAAATGDVQFKGHADGQYAHSADTYGILIDAAFGPGNIGLGVGGGASDFEVAFLEVRNLDFAGMMFKTDNDGGAHMDNVKIHDNYIHDTISEGVYLGSTQAQPQHKFRNLEFYNNRLIRTGTEIGQFGNLADGSRIHHNVFLLGALDWKNPFQQYQDNGIQLGHREGSMSFDHNIVIGAASSGMILFNNDVAGDVHDPSDLLTINNNYFAYSRNRGVYIHSASDGIKQVEFRDNHFSEIVFTFDEVYPGSTNGMRIINSANNDNPISLTDNVFEGQAGQSFYAGGGNITANNNSNQPVNDIQFNHQRWPGGGDYFALEIWTAEDINGQPVSYVVGDLVLHQSQIYEAQQDINYLNDPHLSPDQSSSDTWLPKPPMADDVRQVEKAEFAHIGLLDLVSDLIFESGFD